MRFKWTAVHVLGSEKEFTKLTRCVPHDLQTKYRPHQKVTERIIHRLRVCSKSSRSNKAHYVARKLYRKLPLQNSSLLQLRQRKRFHFSQLSKHDFEETRVYFTNFRNATDVRDTLLQLNFNQTDVQKGFRTLLTL